MGSNALAVFCIAIGLLIILGRGPLIFVPERTMELYRRLLSTDPMVRAVGLCVGALGAGLALLAKGDGETVALGLVLAAVGLMLIVFPGPYRRLATSVLDFARDSIHSTVIRAVGLLAVGIGAFLVHLGFRLL